MSATREGLADIQLGSVKELIDRETFLMLFHTCCLGQALIPSRLPRQGESFLGRKWLIGKKIKKELDKPEGISHAKMV